MQTLTYDERRKIEYYLRLKLSERDIARRLGRDHTVVGREISRNTKAGQRYAAINAERLAGLRSHKTNTRKLESDRLLHDYVISKLREGWSPEEISGRLKAKPPPHLWGTTISHEAIYQYIYEGEGRYESLYSRLRRKQPKRRKKRGRKPHTITIPERTSIHTRGIEINERKRVGDWESDTVEFRQKRADALSVQQERKSRLARIHRIENRSAEATERALWMTVDSVPSYLVKSFTFDNGGEGARHTVFRREGIETFFCDPYASWQKGGVENLNGLIREYLPRGTNLREITDETIHEIQERLNNRPRKILGYQTPNEVFHQAHSSEGGALNC